MTKASTIKSIYKCLLRDVKTLQQTPHFRLRTALRLEQWGTGYYLPPPTTVLQNQHIQSLQVYQNQQEQGFHYTQEQKDLPQVIRQSFKKNRNIQDSTVCTSIIVVFIMVVAQTHLLLGNCNQIR